jgi:uncharacterized RDD family membrane protein YckC
MLNGNVTLLAVVFIFSFLLLFAYLYPLEGTKGVTLGKWL